ncbi:MAG: hypothetical protein ABIJ00_02900 [Candidatus Eisenbacteria bacterium]
MRTRMTGGVLLITGLAITCSLIVLPGCSEKESGDREVGLAPDTFISFGPKEATLTYFKVQAYWYGADDDGDVASFQIATVRDVERIDLETLDLETLNWTDTFEREGTFVLPSDTCCLDSTENPAQDPQYAKALWGILVRAVDNEGRIDPSPASLFFTATNIIPRVSIVVPQKTVWGYRTVPPHPYIEWEGSDPDGDAAALEYKYIVIPEDSLKPTYPRLPPLNYTDSHVEGHASPGLGRWSNWVPADCTSVRDLELSSWIGGGLDHPVNVFVTVKDEGGAFLPENLYGNRYNDGRNSIKLVIIATGDGVKIKIAAGSLGLRQSGQEAQYENNIAGLFQGTEISFRFWGLEERARGEIAEAYRYYYDNPDDPTSAWNYWTSTEPIRDRRANPEWLVRYPLNGGRFAPSLGRHVFVVEVKDVNQVQTHCEFNVEVLEGPRRLPERKILLVDDDHAKYLEPAWAQFDATQTGLWEDILDGYDWERFYTGRAPSYSGYGEEVPIRFAGGATTVIWLADDESVENPVSQLLKVCTELGNYLHSYVKVGGNLIIIGQGPVRATAYWSDWVENIPGQPHPDRRQNFTLLNFNPRYLRAEDDTLYNFMWEAFGIKKMKTPSPEIPYNMIWPCQICGSDWEGPIEAVPKVGPWRGEFGSAFYITEIRRADDERWPLDVEAMYSTAYNDSGVITPTEDNLIAVYAPGDERRGHAAYIGFPAEWFDHDEMKTMIRKLLTKFGETPQ